jgi:hypothetical protein
MALISNIEQTSFGIPVSNAYTFITNVSIDKKPVLTVPTTEGGEPTTVSNHTITFRTESYVSQSARDNGNSPIAGHGYTIALDYSANSNIMQVLYTWLKTNISIFSSSTDA